MKRAALRALLLVSFAVVEAHAQVLSLTLTTQGTGQPVSGALVTLVSREGDTAKKALTNRGGVATMAGRAGEFTIHVRRIGYLPFTAAKSLRLSDGDTTRLSLAIPAIATELPAVTTRSHAKCTRGAGEQLASSALWEQIRTALETSQLSPADSDMFTFRRMAMLGVSRDDDPIKLLGMSESMARDLPYAARAPDVLSREGFVTHDYYHGAVYDGPDARVLLSREFEEDHCFGIVQGTGPTSGLVGLSFTPAADRTVADIDGVLWVSRSNASLEFLEFRYADNKSSNDASAAGGRVTFERLPDGGWIVHDWHLHFPTPDIPIPHAGPKWTWNDIGGVADAVEASLARIDGTGALVCADSERPMVVHVYTMVPLHDRTVPSRSMVVADWFASSPDAGKSASEVGIPIVIPANAAADAKACLPKRPGVLTLTAYSDELRSDPTVVSPDSSHVPIGLTFRDDVAPVPSSLRARMSFTVRDSSGTALAGAEIKVSGRSPKDRTDNRGRLSTRDVYAGFQVIDAWRPGFVRQRVLVWMPTNLTRDIEIRLTPVRGG